MGSERFCVYFDILTKLGDFGENLGSSLHDTQACFTWPKLLQQNKCPCIVSKSLMLVPSSLLSNIVIPLQPRALG